MRASNDPSLAFPKNKPENPPGVLARGWKKSAKDAKLEKAYRDVDEYDGSRCRVTGVQLVADSLDAKRRREHHHIRGRVGALMYDVRNILSVSAYVHELITRHILLVIGTDARKPIYFAWNAAFVKPGKSPFVLRPSVRPPQAVAS